LPAAHIAAAANLQYDSPIHYALITSPKQRQEWRGFASARSLLISSSHGTVLRHENNSQKSITTTETEHQDHDRQHSHNLRSATTTLCQPSATTPAPVCVLIVLQVLMAVVQSI